MNSNPHNYSSMTTTTFDKNKTQRGRIGNNTIQLINTNKQNAERGKITGKAMLTNNSRLIYNMSVRDIDINKTLDDVDKQ